METKIADPFFFFFFFFFFLFLLRQIPSSKIMSLLKRGRVCNNLDNPEFY